MKKNKIYKLIISIAIVASVFIFSGDKIFAEVVESENNATTAVVEVTPSLPMEQSQNNSTDIPITIENPIKIQDVASTDIVQSTYNTQQSVSNDILTNTATDTMIIALDSSTIDQPITSGADHVVDIKDSATSTKEVDTNISDIDDNPSQVQDDNKDTKDIVEAEKTEIAPEEYIFTNEDNISAVVVSKPKAKYSFSINKNIVSHKRIPNPNKNRKNKNIATNAKSLDQSNKNVDSKDPDTVLQQVDYIIDPVIDNDTGTMSLSGMCLDTYYVVLLYKNMTDYTENPGSYIFNKAFKCENNSFSYSVSDLPSNLPSGNYYMLIGDQGDRGTWTPATQLTEITINRMQ